MGFFNHEPDIVPPFEDDLNLVLRFLRIIQGEPGSRAARDAGEEVDRIYKRQGLDHPDAEKGRWKLNLRASQMSKSDEDYS